jgi:predicted transcriptional regulator YheO
MSIAPAAALIEAIKPVLDAVGATFVAPDERQSSDVPLVWEGIVVAIVRTAPLHNVLDRLIESVESDLGGRLGELPREDKQRAVRLLHERGAFVLRKAVDDIADRMRVSRITVYNYLNAITR